MDAKKPDTGASEFSKEEVERRALETARRMLNTPPKPKGGGPRAPKVGGDGSRHGIREPRPKKAR